MNVFSSFSQLNYYIFEWPSSFFNTISWLSLMSDALIQHLLPLWGVQGLLWWSVRVFQCVHTLLHTPQQDRTRCDISDSSSGDSEPSRVTASLRRSRALIPAHCRLRAPKLLPLTPFALRSLIRYNACCSVVNTSLNNVCRREYDEQGQK